MQSLKRKLLNSTVAASGIEYGTLISLVVLVGLLAIREMGTTANEPFLVTQSEMNSRIGESGANPNAAESSPPPLENTGTQGDGDNGTAQPSEPPVSCEPTTTWVAQAGPGDVIFDGTRLVGLGPGGDTLMTSGDGITWNSQTIVGASSLYEMRFNGSQWIAFKQVTGPYDENNVFGTMSPALETEVYLSGDGVNWTYQAILPVDSFEGAAHDGNQWVAVGVLVPYNALGGMATNDYVIWTSPDGANWTGRGPNNPSNNEMYFDVVYDGGQWLAPKTTVTIFGTNTQLATSSNGVSWTLRQVPGGSLNSVAYDGTQWVGVGNNGGILTSPNGTTWTTRQSGGSNLLNVSHNGVEWLAVGASGTILSSPDGITWTSQDSGTGADLRYIAHDGSKWIVGSVDTNYTPPVSCD